MTTPTTHLHELTVASLEGLAAALTESAREDREQSLVALRVYGDAIRLGVEAPRIVREWAAKPGWEHVDEALRYADQRLLVPIFEDHATARAMLDGEAIENRFIERDWAESALVAARRAVPVDDFKRCVGGLALTEKLERFDTGWGAVVSRELLIDLLGERAAFRPTYALRYPALTGALADSELEGTQGAALDEELPSDDTIARYLHGGVFARTVEAVAARNADFAETLRAIYDAHAQSGEITSIRAGAWRRRGTKRDRTARSKAAVVVGVAPARAAAASTTFENESRWVQLGRDETLACGFELSVEVLPDTLVVHVDLARRGELAEVRVGDVSVPVGPDDDEVELRVARRPELPLVVRDREGVELRETLELVAEDKAIP